MIMTNQTIRSMIPAAAAIAALFVDANFTATAGAQQRGRGTAPSEQHRTPSDIGLHGYSVVLVIGDMQAPGSGDSVPSAARKALTDMQAFLPYKRYQLLDAAWMICCGMFRSPLSGRVRGPDNGEYQYSIETLNLADERKLTVRFSMRDVGTTATFVAAGGVGRGSTSSSSGGGRGSARGSAGSASRNAEADVRNDLRIVSETARLELHSRLLYDAIKERDDAELALRTIKEAKTDSHPQVVAATARHSLAQRRVDDLQHSAQGGGVGSGSGSGGGRGSAGRSIMDSTFSIALGETVVIGTSRLKGDQALIALLTAATKPGAAR
jgi:hypothetical protein